MRPIARCLTVMVMMGATSEARAQADDDPYPAMDYEPIVDPPTPADSESGRAEGETTTGAAPQAVVDAAPAPSGGGEGPVALTFTGAAMLVAGASVAAIGAADRECSEAECRSRFGFLIGGGVGGALLGGLGMGLGLHFWQRELGESDEEGAVRADPAMFGTGILLVVVGSTATAAGYFGSFVGAHTLSFPSHSTYGMPNPGQPLLLVSGAALLALGIPLLSLGGMRVDPDGEPSSTTLRLGPSGFVLSGQL